jgi:hypothetical protein
MNEPPISNSGAADQQTRRVAVKDAIYRVLGIYAAGVLTRLLHAGDHPPEAMKKKKKKHRNVRSCA